MSLKIFILLSFCACYCVGFNILVVFPHSGMSHFKAFEPLFKALAEKGHNVTVISYFPQKKPIPNYRDVYLQNPFIGVEALTMDELPRSRLVHYTGPLMISYFGQIDCAKGLQNDNFVKFLREDNKFDVILGEVFNTNCFMGLVKKYKAPLIGK